MLDGIACQAETSAAQQPICFPQARRRNVHCGLPYGYRRVA
jgi:hypothetical protein